MELYTVNFENNSEILKDSLTIVEIYRHPIWLITLYIIAYSVIFFIGLIGNSVVVYLIVFSKTLQSSTNFYIVNLAVADLLVIVCCIPPTVVSHIYIPWHLGWVLCKIVAYVQGLSICASVYSLVAISVDRFLAVWNPSPSRIESEKGFARLTITLIWIFSGALMIPWAFYFNTTNEVEGQDPDSEFCLEIWPEYLNGNIFYLVVNLFLGYIIPLIIILFCYFCIWFRVWKRYVPTNDTSAEAEASFTKSQSTHIKLMHQRAKVSILKMVIIIVLVFALSWLPLYITFTYLKFSTELSEREMLFFSIVTPISQWLSSSSSAINPCLYAFINKKFRRVLSTKIQRFRNNNNNSLSNSNRIVHVDLQNMSNGNGSRTGGRSRSRSRNDPEVADTFV